MGSPLGTTTVAALVYVLVAGLSAAAAAGPVAGGGEQPLSKIGIHRTTIAIQPGASVDVSPLLLGLVGQDQEWVTLRYSNPKPFSDDWIGVFSPANFNDSICTSENQWVEPPLLCTAPIKFQYANYTSIDYAKTGKGSLRLQIINQRSDFSFALFSGGLSNPKLIAHSNRVTFVNPKAPVYPRLAQGKSWNEMTVTWTSGYSTKEATPFVEWGIQGQIQILSPAGTLTFSRNSMCGTHTELAIGYLMVQLFGDVSIVSKHLLILGKTLCNVLSFLEIWARPSLMAQTSTMTLSVVQSTRPTS